MCIKKQIKGILIGLLISQATLLCAQSYASLILERIGQDIPQHCLPKKDSIFHCPSIIKEKSLVVNYNDKGEISHLGVSLFSKEAKEMINKPVCDFIERMMLEFVLHKNESEFQKKLQINEITIERSGTGYEYSVRNISEALKEMKEPVKFYLQQETFFYLATWIFEDNSRLNMRFPASRELIFGTNKRESDEALNELLFTQSNCKEEQYVPCFFDQEQVEQMGNSHVFVKRGNFYSIPEINAHIYCIESEEKNYVPIYDPKYAKTSLRNLLLTNNIRTSLTLSIKHRGYEEFSPEFEIKLSDFVCFFQNEFDSYCAVEDQESGTLKATLILYNREFNYSHMLISTLSKDVIFMEGGIIHAEFYSNIPQHNTKNLTYRKNN